MVTTFLDTLPKSLNATSRGRGRPRKFITAEFITTLKANPNKWALVKRSANATEVARLRTQAAEVGLAISFVSTASTNRVSRNGRAYTSITGDVYARFETEEQAQAV